MVLHDISLNCAAVFTHKISEEEVLISKKQETHQQK